MNTTTCPEANNYSFILQPFIQDVILTLGIGILLILARWMGIKIKSHNQKLNAIHEKLDGAISASGASTPPGDN